MNSKVSYMWKINNKYCFCSEPWKIENYDKAIADTTQVWVCHHRLGTHTSDGEKRLVQLTKKELQALDMYYNRPPEEFIFLTAKAHRILHDKGNESRSRKISIAQLGNTNGKGNKGRKYSEETKKKMSIVHKGWSWKLDPATGKRVWYKKEV